MLQTIKKMPLVSKCIAIGIICIYIFTIICFVFSFDINFSLSHFNSKNFQIHQLFTYSFAHAIDPFHLIYNLCYFLIFSCILELEIKKKIFIILILFTIIIDVILINIQPLLFEADWSKGFVGLSTILFAVMIFFFLHYKNSKNETHIFLLKLFVLIVIFEEMIIFLRGYKNNTFMDPEFATSYAHISGVIAGLLFFLILKFNLFSNQGI